LYLAIALAATVSWGGFISYATNNERANSSVVRSLSFQLRANDEVAAFLGGRVRTPPLFGEFRLVNGSVRSLKANFALHALLAALPLPDIARRSAAVGTLPRLTGR